MSEQEDMDRAAAAAQVSGDTGPDSLEETLPMAGDTDGTNRVQGLRCFMCGKAPYQAEALEAHDKCVFCFKEFQEKEQVMWCDCEKWTFDGSVACLHCSFEARDTFLLSTKTSDEKRRQAGDRHVASFEGKHWKLYLKDWHQKNPGEWCIKLASGMTYQMGRADMEWAQLEGDDTQGMDIHQVVPVQVFPPDEHNHDQEMNTDGGMCLQLPWDKEWQTDLRTWHESQDNKRDGVWSVQDRKGKKWHLGIEGAAYGELVGGSLPVLDDFPITIYLSSRTNLPRSLPSRESGRRETSEAEDNCDMSDESGHERRTEDHRKGEWVFTRKENTRWELWLQNWHRERLLTHGQCLVQIADSKGRLHWMGISGTAPGTIRGDAKLTSSDFPIDGRIIQEIDLPLALRNEHKQHEAYRLRAEAACLDRVREEAHRRIEGAKEAIRRIGVPPELRHAHADVFPAAAASAAPVGGRPDALDAGRGAPASSGVTQNGRQGEEDPMMKILMQLEKLSARVERMELRGNSAQQEQSTRGAPPEESAGSSGQAPQAPVREPPGDDSAKGTGKGKGGVSFQGLLGVGTPPLLTRGLLRRRGVLEGVERRG